MEGLRKPVDLMVIVVTLLTSGCPVQALVPAFGLDERTVAAWRDRAGVHCHKVHQAIVEQATLDLVPLQADESRVKGQHMMAWMGLAMMVSTRLWLAGTVGLTRDCRQASRLMWPVCRCAQALCPLLVLPDGWAAYPNRIQRAFREKVKQTLGRGRACLRIWPQLHMGTVIKHPVTKRGTEIPRQMAHGSLEQAEQLLARSQGGSVLNTAFIERLNGTFRERLATLTRTSRHAARRLRALERGMDLIGWTSTCCFAHHELSKPTHQGSAGTPAMAAGLTDHLWSIRELLSYQVRPLPWVQPKRRGRPKKLAAPIATAVLRPRVRLRKGILCSTTG